MVAGILGFLFGAAAISGSQSAIHEIEALISFVIGVIGVGLAATVSGLEAIRREIAASRLRPAPPPTPAATDPHGTR
jgi:hypothetical protein